MGRADDSLGQAGLKEPSFPRNSARKTAENKENKGGKCGLGNVYDQIAVDKHFSNGRERRWKDAKQL